MAGPLATAPWRRAPVLLLRRPVVWLAIFASMAVLGAAAASGVLFVSTLATASVRAQAASDCAESAMPQYATSAAPDEVARTNAHLVHVLRGVSAAPGPFTVDTASVAVGATALTLFVRAGATMHVHRLTPATSASGAWLPQRYALQAHAHVGSVLKTTGGGRLTVVGIYRDLAPDPFKIANLPRYWCTWKDLALQRIDAVTPPLVLTDEATVAAARPDDGVVASVYDPIPDLTITNAMTAERRAGAAALAAGLIVPDSTTVGHARLDPLQDKIDYADRVQHGLQGSVVPIDVAGSVVALLLVAGAGGFWATHRAREIRLLASRGVAPRHLGVKAVLETAPAAVLGCAVGVVTARVLVQRVGPASVFTPHAFARASAVAVAALVCALGLVFVIGLRAAREAPRGRGRFAHLVPWELALVLVAVWAAIRLRARSGVEVDHTVVTVRPLLLVFPIVGVAGAVLLFARLLWLGRRPFGRLAPRLGRGGYLALRRMVRAPGIALGLLVGTALPVALLTYAGTVDYGTAHEVAAKYRTNLGAPHVLVIIGAHNDKPVLRGHGSAVVSYGPTEATLPDGSGVAVLGVDTASFDRFAYLDGAQRAGIARLSGAAALFVNADDLAAPSAMRIGNTRVTVRVVARLAVFPGLTAGRFPLLVVDRNRLAHVDATADRRNLVFTDDAQAAAARETVLDDGYSVLSEVDPQFRLNSTGLLPITWIFGYLRALAFLIGVVAAAGLVFGLAARTRQRTVAYVMSRRMGMRPAVHVRSLVVELGLLIGLGWLGGVAAGGAAFAVIVSALDVYPDLPPGAAFALPASVVAGSGVAVVVVVLLATLATHRLAERANPADVLRLE